VFKVISHGGPLGLLPDRICHPDAGVETADVLMESCQL
jgi:hypothetical protein